MSCCARWLPTTDTSTNVVASAPTMAPAVLAAYRRPTARRGSSPPAIAAASASGKLAPQSNEAGSTTYATRSRVRDGAFAAVLADRRHVADDGSRRVIAYAAAAIARASSAWHDA